MSKSHSEDYHTKPFLIVSAILTLIIVIVGVLFLSRKGGSSQPQLPTPNTYEYYWSSNCAHCDNVNEFMITWNGKDKIKLDKYDIDASTLNKKRLLDRGVYCNFPRQELGVPFMVTPDGLCFWGDKPIINYFKNLNYSK